MPKTVSIQRFDSRCANRYKEVKYDPPKVNLGYRGDLEKVTDSDLAELEGMLT